MSWALLNTNFVHKYRPRYNSPSQPEWQSVAMDGPLHSLSSPWIEMPSRTDEAAWFVQVSTPPSEVPHAPAISANFTDASPIRFAFRTPSKASMCLTPDVINIKASPEPAGRCQPSLDAICNANIQCVTAIKKGGFQLPLLARDDGSKQDPSTKAWRCYSLSALSPDRSHYTGGPAYCTDYVLADALAQCEANTTATLLFGKGTLTPSGALSRANEP